MDLLYQRYASPISYVDGMIQTRRFNEFVDNLVRTVNEERNEKAEWDVWLHKVWDVSFDEFRETIRIDTANQNMSAGTIETTVQNSMDILNNFTPEQGGEN